MLLTIKDLINILRESVNVQYAESETVDPAYLVMSDEDIELFIKLGVTRAFPKVTDLSELPNGSEYPITLLAKIELYSKLAVINSTKVDLSADGSSISQSQRFDYYMKLISEAKEQYESWLSNEGVGDIECCDVLLGRRHYSSRNYEKQSRPRVTVVVDEVTTDSVKFHWSLSNSSYFGRYKVYISKKPIVNMYNEGAYYENKLDKEAILIKSTSNIKDTYCEVSGLEKSTKYYLAVISIERNQVFGFKEVSFDTLMELQPEAEFSRTTI